MVGSSQEFLLDEEAESHHRTRRALLVLLAGVAVLLATVGLAMMRAGAPVETDGSGGPAPGGVGADEAATTRAAMIMLIYGTILLVVFVVAAVTLVVASRNFRRRLTREAEKPMPTPTDDVWSQHKLPEDTSTSAEPPAEDC